MLNNKHENTLKTNMFLSIYGPILYPKLNHNMNTSMGYTKNALKTPNYPTFVKLD